MVYIVVLLVAALNCVVLFFLSLLAAGGDGSADGIHRVWYFGYPWIAIISLVALYQCAKHRRAAAIVIVASTLPAGFAALLVGLITASVLGKFKPASPELKAACEGAGPNYMQKPAAVVESIAFDWPVDSHPPVITYFEVDGRGNVRNLRGGRHRFPPPITFTEGRCCQFEGPPRNRVRPFVRHPKLGDYYGIPDLTADVLITYNVSNVALPSSKTNLMTVDMAVTDRRDGRMLATLRYVLDQQGKRGCGAVTEGVMDEYGFIRRAIAID